MISPPLYVLPEPIDNKTSPPLPFVALPVNRLKCPDVPLLAVPDVNDNMPLTPDVPAFMVLITTAPLVSVLPSPDVNDTAPPLKGSL
jgi:hypothetical protein